MADQLIFASFVGLVCHRSLLLFHVDVLSFDNRTVLTAQTSTFRAKDSVLKT